jgi:predicted glycosyltransferase
MATESATLGVPAICVNSSAKCFGVFDDFINNKLIEVIPDNDAAILRSKELLCDPRLNDDMNIKSERFMRDKIDMTEFMVRFIENYPVSSKIMNKNTIKPYKK